MIKTINKVFSLARKLPASSSEIIPIVNSQVFGWNYETLSVNSFIKNLRVTTKIRSLPPAVPPDIELTDSDSQRIAKTLRLEWQSPRKQLDIYLSISNAAPSWEWVGSFSLLNLNGYPFRVFNLMDILTDGLAVELGQNGVLGVGISDVGYGVLTPQDTVTLHGSYVQEIVYEDDAERIASTSTDISEIIIDNSEVVLSGNPNRKYFLLQNRGDEIAYLNFGKESTPGNGVTLLPGNHYELDIKIFPWYGTVTATCEQGRSTIISGIEST